MKEFMAKRFGNDQYFKDSLLSIMEVPMQFPTGFFI